MEKGLWEQAVPGVPGDLESFSLESVPFSFLIHTKLNIYEHASLKMGNSAAHSVSSSLVGNTKY